MKQNEREEWYIHILYLIISFGTPLYTAFYNHIRLEKSGKKYHPQWHGRMEQHLSFKIL